LSLLTDGQKPPGGSHQKRSHFTARVMTRAERSAVQIALSQNDVIALLIVIGSLSQLPDDGARRRVLRYSIDRYSKDAER